MNTIDRVKAAVAAVLKVPADSLTASSSPDDVQSWDSMHHLQIVIALEEEFGVQFAADEIDGLQTVGALSNWISEHGK
jgi:acyl carrier protein